VNTKSLKVKDVAELMLERGKVKRAKNEKKRK
jgi:hypothetical protein